MLSRSGKLNPPSAPASETRGDKPASVLEMPLRNSPETATPAAMNSISALADVESEHEPSLERYIKHFQYQPPDFSNDELTMRGDSPVREAETSPRVAAEPLHPIAEESPADLSDAPAYPAPPLIMPRVQPNEYSRPTSILGDLSPREAVNETTERSRFLDIQEQSTSKPGSGTSTIVGPSFLGLSDAPGVPTEYLEDSQEPARSHWRLWLALFVVLLFGALGYLEWRTQSSHVEGRPLDMIRNEIERLRHRKQSSNVSAPPAVSDTNASNSPSEPQSSTANSTSTAGASSPAVTPNTSTQNPGSDSSAAQPSSPTAATSSAQNQASSTSEPANGSNPLPPEETNRNSDAATAAKTVKPPATADAKTRNTATGNDQEVTTRKVIPGQDEMARATNASDATAAAAWLWKATAKGNPDAPVRLADLYIRGDGVPHDCDQALVLLKSAAAKQNARARSKLGSMYATGTCVARDRVQAYRWLNAAVATDSASDWAKQNRDMIWRQMTPAERTAAAKYE
jgi:hypothetical protein